MVAKNQILLIEDDEDVAQSLRVGLEREQYSVAWETRGAQGVEYARAHHPHLIILDVRLPDGSGFDFCREMRQLGLRQPILILTALQTETDKVLGLEIGADDYITKPFNLRELLSRVRAHLRRAYGDFSNAEREDLYAGDLTVDLTVGQVMLAGKTVVLTPTEFRLLVYLIRHRNQALTRSQIVEEVWGFSSDLDSEKTVNVHIRHLREKIEVDPSRPALILTVPGIGYRLLG